MDQVPAEPLETSVGTLYGSAMKTSHGSPQKIALTSSLLKTPVLNFTDSPSACEKAVVVWLWSAPALVRQKIATKLDRFGGPCSSSVSNSALSSFSTAGRAASSCGNSMPATPKSPCSSFERRSAGTQPISGDEELVEVTILESGSCATVDDSVVLALCVLLSSHLVYNGAELLDAARIQNLTSLRDLPNTVSTRQDSSMEDGVAFREHFPRLSWLLRDSDAPLIDERRHPISASAYLERALKVRGFSDEAEQKNMLRKMIASFFPEQDCHVLPSPAAIPGLPLGERFLRKLVSIRGSILSAVPVKTVMGRDVDGAMLQDLAQAYVEDINGSLPLCIPRACDHMSVKRCELAMQRALQLYHLDLKVFRALLPISDAAVLGWHSETRVRTHQVLASMAVTDMEELREQLDLAMVQLQKEIVKENEDCSREKATELLERLYSDCEQRVRTGDIRSLDVYEIERDKVRKEFEARTSDLSQYTCRMTMLEFMEKRLMRFSQTLLRNTVHLQAPRQSGSGASGRMCAGTRTGGSREGTPTRLSPPGKTPPLSPLKMGRCSSKSPGGTV